MRLLRSALALLLVSVAGAGCGAASIRAIPSWSGPTAEGSGADTGWFVAKSGRYVTVIHCESTPVGLDCSAQTIDPETAQVIGGR